jgi:hypothetical protein
MLSLTRIILILTLLTAPASVARAIEQPPAPTLQALSNETQALYEYVRPGVVRIQLPPTYWPSQASDNMLEKWKGKLDPEVIKQLQQEQARAAAGGSVDVAAEVAPAATQPSTTQPTDPQGNVLVAPVPPRLSVLPRPDGGIEIGPFSASGTAYDAQIPSLSLHVIGLLLDDKGHVLVPLYIEPGALGDEPLRVRTGDGQKSTVTFVGSDRQTNLTVFKLQSAAGHPVRITRGRPADGSLVMVLSPAGDAGRLTIWTGGQQDRGIVVTMDGGVAGFARYGQFLIGAYAQPVVDQLIQHGRVRRATLGVLVEETETPDGRRAMQIEKVMPGSAADDAKLLEGDYILSMAGTPVGDLPSFAAAIAARDGETPLEILRGDQTFTATVMLKVK